MRKLAIFLLLLVFPFGQLLRWSVPGTAVVLQANDFIVAAVVLIWCRPTAEDGLFWPILFWILIMILSLTVNIPRVPLRELAVASLYLVRWVFYAGIYFVFKGLSPVEKTLTKRWLLIGVVIVAGAGLAQFILIPNVSFLAAQNWDDHYYRLISTFLDPGFTGAILVLGLVISKFALVPMLFIYLAMALTYSRASYLMYVVVFGALAYYQRSLRIFVIALVVLVLTIPFLPRSTGEGTKLARENSIEARITNWRESITIWSKSPVFGIGYDAYRYVRGAKDESHSGAGADSSLLLVLATTGGVGMLAYGYLLTVMWRVGRKDVIFAASFLGVLVHSWFNNTLFYPWVMEWLWILLSLV